MSHRSCFTMLVALLATGCSQQDKKPRLPEQAVVGTWLSDTSAAAPGAGRGYRLRMAPKGMAEFVTLANGRDSLGERGTWDGADSLVRVVVRGEGTASRPTSLLLAIRGRNQLALVRFDTATWGERGLTLYRRVENGTSAP